AVVLGDDLVARAVIADVLAERQVHIQRQRPRRGARNAREQRIDVLFGGKCLGEAIGGGIRRVPRPEAVVFANQRRVERQGRGAVSQRGVRSCHTAIVPAAAAAGLEPDQGAVAAGRTGLWRRGLERGYLTYIMVV